ncbi:MAG: DUF4838 domain-containing protein [Victivallales bacterium]|nr:DUF4838 domain-containing protein [Victivallales bacterium]
MTSVFVLLSAGAMAFECVLPENPTGREKAASEFLRREAELVCKESGTKFRIRTDESMPEESWEVSGQGGTVTMKSGKFGHFHAVAHYLKDVCGVKYLTPEETIYKKHELPGDFKTISGGFYFSVRDINNACDWDNGRFATLRGLNGNGGSGSAIGNRGNSISFGNGGRSWFGSPWLVHTTWQYMPVSKYFSEHPEWYAEINGKRSKMNDNGSATQLCLSNKEMRKEFLNNLRASIRRAKESAAKNGVEAPAIYAIDQNDNQNYCRCAECNAMAEKYGGAQAGIILDFANEMGEAIAAEKPDVMLCVLAYQYSEAAPKGIRPAKNVVVCFTDTASNILQPLASSQNSYFNGLLGEWSKIAHTLRVWDYCITYQTPSEMPYNSEWTYQSDLQLFHKCNVKQVFAEMEETVLSDVRDYKMLLKTALMENPYLDYAKLRRETSTDLYGKAAGLFLQYRELLKKSQDSKGTGLGMYPSANSFTHLDLDTVVQSQRLFEEGLSVLADSPAELVRWKRARIGIDRASLICSRGMMLEYKRHNGSLDGYPFDREAIAERLRKVVLPLVEIRLPEKSREKFVKRFEKELATYLLPIPESSLEMPEQFRGIPKERVFDYNLENTMRWRDIAKMVDDPESTMGRVARIEFPNSWRDAKIDNYQFPITFGTYSEKLRKTLWWANLTKARVTRRGYNWYKIGATPLEGDAIMYFFRAWSIKMGVGDAYDMNEPDRKVEVWIHIKFTGPSFPLGIEGEQDAIWFDRVILIKEPK